MHPSRWRAVSGHSLSQEFLLLAACCIWPPSPRRNAAIERAAAGAIDWDKFLHLVTRHRVAGLAHQGLSSVAQNMPPTVAESLAEQATSIARQNLLHAAETRRLQRLFDEAGIPVVFVKGVSLGVLVYGSLGLKHARDIDMLVPPAFSEQALKLLEEVDYQLRQPYRQFGDGRRHLIFRYSKDAELINSRSGVEVELHWGLTDNPLLLKNVDCASPVQIVAPTKDCGIRTLNDRDLFAYLCAHGAIHGWSRLKWLADVGALIARKDDAEIVALYRHAQACGAGLCAGQTLLLCERLLDCRLPAQFAMELHGNRRLERLAVAAMSVMTSAVVEIEGNFSAKARGYLRPFTLGRGRAFFAAQCRARAVMLVDVARFPLHPSLHFLYPFLGLPLWVWRRGLSIRRLHTRRSDVSGGSQAKDRR